MKLEDIDRTKELNGRLTLVALALNILETRYADVRGTGEINLGVHYPPDATLRPFRIVLDKHVIREIIETERGRLVKSLQELGVEV